MPALGMLVAVVAQCILKRLQSGVYGGQHLLTQLQRARGVAQRVRRVQHVAQHLAALHLQFLQQPLVRIEVIGAAREEDEERVHACGRGAELQQDEDHVKESHHAQRPPRGQVLQHAQQLHGAEFT